MVDVAHTHALSLTHTHTHTLTQVSGFFHSWVACLVSPLVRQYLCWPYALLSPNGLCFAQCSTVTCFPCAHFGIKWQVIQVRLSAADGGDTGLFSRLKSRNDQKVSANVQVCLLSDCLTCCRVKQKVTIKESVNNAMNVSFSHDAV